ALLRGLRDVAAADRPAVGARVNEVKAEIERLLEEALGRSKSAALEAELRVAPLDVTLAGRQSLPAGHRHPVQQTLEDIVETFALMCSRALEGPEVELDYYNFEALNLPSDPPVRDSHDTFSVDAAVLGDRAPKSAALLRTHTSPVQIRAMLANKPPLRI